MRWISLIQARPFSRCLFLLGRAACIQACQKLGDAKRAFDLFEAATTRDGVRLDNAALLALVSTLEAAGEYERAAEVRRSRSRM